MITNFKELKSSVLARIDIYDVLNWYGVRLNRNNKARCIIHNSRGENCFWVNPRTQRYTCFVCKKDNHTGDGLDFIMEVENVDFIGAVYIAGYNLGLITREERDNRRIDNTKERKINTFVKAEVKKVEPPKPEVIKPLTEEEIERNSIVYNALAYVCGLEEKYKEELINDRHIKEARTKEYFTIKPNSEELIGKIITLCDKYYKLSEDDIANVPGFYKDSNGKVQLNNKMKTLAIIIKDYKGRSRTIQIKNRFAKENDVKYYYLSSNSVGGDKARIWVDVISPNIEESMPTLFITEGKFKAELINNTYNCPVISIPGIKSYVDKLKEEINVINATKRMKHLMIALDSDMATNIAVGESVINILEKELKDIEFKNRFVVVWDGKYGKGIDDVILNGNKEYILKIRANDFIKSYKEIIEEVSDYNENDKKEYIEFLYRKYILEGMK